MEIAGVKFQELSLCLIIVLAEQRSLSYTKKQYEQNEFLGANSFLSEIHNLIQTI
jgi:hypothetical protein